MKPILLAMLLPGFTLVFATAFAQNSFSSGSTGTDGDLIFTNPPSPRTRMVGCFDAKSNKIVAFGGNAASVAYRETWEWDGVRWLQVATAQLPPAGEAMEYDPIRQVPVLFDGTKTWNYVDRQWVETSAAGPSVRHNPELVFDPITRTILLIGGRDPAGNDNTPSLKDTWSWDGSTWKAVGTAISLPPRSWPAVGVLNGKVYLFGGLTNGYCNSGTDTLYEWTGTDWVLRSPAGLRPPSVGEAALAYSSTLEKLILFGGEYGNCISRQGAWTFDGAVWQQLADTGLPSPRDSPLLLPGPNSDLVLFGGDVGGNVGTTNSETLLFDGESWRAPSLVGPNAVFDTTEKPDGVWNFGRIAIPTGCTVRFKRNGLNTAITWLAAGDVEIGGSLLLEGADADAGSLESGKQAGGGPGGYDGGRGGVAFNTSASFQAMPGDGPGGGMAGTTSGQDGGGAGHAVRGGSNSASGIAGDPYGSQLTNPLQGGSGGGGEASTSTANGGSGGGGGGAILIASSGKIVLDGDASFTNGIISVDGGRGYLGGGGGAGGSIRLIANVIRGDGFLRAQGGNNYWDGSIGRIRLEAWSVEFSGASYDQSIPDYTIGPPLSVGLAALPTLRVTQVDGVNVTYPASPSTASPYVVFNQAGAVAVRVETQNVPNGASITVRIALRGQVLTQSGSVSGNVATVNFASVPAGEGTVQAFSSFAN